jgi:hypothetical protein
MLLFLLHLKKETCTQAVGEYLSASAQDASPGNQLQVEMLGGPVRSSLLTVDPAIDGQLEHLEYAPLVNARAHALGGATKA